MPAAIVLPELDVGDELIRLSSWFVEVGESVEPGDRVVELLVRGITYDVPSPASGRLASIGVPVQSPVKSGDVVGWIATENDSGDYEDSMRGNPPPGDPRS